MAANINILFLGGAKRVSLAETFISAGKTLGKEINIFSYELDGFVPIASVAKIIVGLRWNDPNIGEHLKQTIQKNGINIVLPFVDPSTVLCSKLKEKMPGVFFPVSAESTCEIFFDKVLANDWFLKNNIPVPGRTNSYPLIAKPRKGSASQGLVVIRSKEELEFFNANHDPIQFLIQSYLKADEYSVDAYVSKKGQVISIVPRKRIEVTSGEVTKSMTVRDNEMIGISRRIFSLIDFSGPITIQFLKDGNNLSLMEINPRFGGGVMTSVKAGADSCMMILKEYLDMPVHEMNDWQENLVMTRAYREFYYYANNN